MIPDRYTLRQWARDAVVAAANTLFYAESFLYEDVLGLPSLPDWTTGVVLHDDGKLRLIYDPEHSPTGRPYRLRVKLSERCWTEEVFAANELSEFMSAFCREEIKRMECGIFVPWSG